MKYMGAHGFTLQYVVLAGILLAFALTQAVIPRTKRGPYVSMPVNAGVGSVLLDKSMTDAENAEPTHDADGEAYAKPEAESEKPAADLQAAIGPDSSDTASVAEGNVITVASGTDTPLEVVQTQIQQDLAIQNNPRPPTET